MLIGSHVSFSKNQLLGSVLETISYGANTFMIYTGAPQNTKRSILNEEFTKSAHKLMESNNIKLDTIVCHAPYIINLANNKDIDKYNFSIDFLKKEIKRCDELGINKLVLHPGSSVKLDKEVALNNIINALNIVNKTNDKVTICLETMAGKGSEIGSTLDELKTIIDKVDEKDKLGICLDTCHLNDSGIDLSKFDEYINEFDDKIGIDKIKVIHINDSKNNIGAKIDRHENIGFGTIGFDNIMNIILDDRFENIPKILETPYIDDNGYKIAPYKYEIEMVKNNKFNDKLKELIISEES
jgi:deoxyribonuclease-4